MKRNSMFIAALAFAATLAVASCDKKDEEQKVFEGKDLPMSGDQEVPVKSTSATGTVDVSYNKDTKLLSYTLNWSNLTGPPSGSHIHGPAERGKNAGIKHDFFSLFPTTASGTFSNSVTIDNVSIKEDSLLAGFYYFNIHTTANPGGEIRGQIEF